MIQRLTIPVITAILRLGVAIVFLSILNKRQDVVPLFLVPLFLYLGYAMGKAPKVWIVGSVAITLALSVLYALP